MGVQGDLYSKSPLEDTVEPSGPSVRRSDGRPAPGTGSAGRRHAGPPEPQGGIVSELRISTSNMGKVLVLVTSLLVNPCALA